MNVKPGDKTKDKHGEIVARAVYKGCMVAAARGDVDFGHQQSGIAATVTQGDGRMRIPRDLERRILATPGVVVVRRHAAHRQRKPHAVPCVYVGGVTLVRVRIPLKLPSLPNCTSLHWRQLGKLKREQKELVAYYLKDAIVPPLPATVTLTRFGPRRLDSDNLAGAFKACRDAIASAYGVDDGDERYSWKYRQKLGKEYAVEIEIESLGS